MTSPIIPYIGGKRRLANKLLPMFPDHMCYVEPFCGAAALYFLKTPSKSEVLNDVNGDIVNLYRVITHHLEEFVRQFKWAVSSRKVFEWQQMTKPEALTDIQRAARFYYLQHHAFGAKVVGQAYGVATTGPLVNFLRIEESLSSAHLRLSQGTNIEHLNWLPCMTRYDRAHTFYYCDPPYWQTEGYGMEFGLEQYQALADFMSNCQGKVMVSLNDHPEMRSVFNRHTIIGGDNFGIRYTLPKSNSRPISKEMVVLNYSP